MIDPSYRQDEPNRYSTSFPRICSVRNAIREFVAHYHLERNHQGLGNRLIMPIGTKAETTGVVERRQRLGGLLNYYYRKAA